MVQIFRSSKLSAHSRWVALALVLTPALAACGSDSNPPSPPSPPDAAPGQMAVPIHLLAAGATEDSITDELSTFTGQTGFPVAATYGAVGALRDMVVAGTAADVVVVTPAIITTLDADHLVHAGSRVDLGQIGGGLAVKAGMPQPTITTSDQFKQALLDADAVYYADPATATAGAQLMKVVDSLGIGDQVRAKGHTAAGGKEAMQAMAQATDAHPVGVTQVSEILSVPQVTLVGEYPPDLQVKTTYSAIIIEGTSRLADAQALVQFFTGTDFQARLARSGFEPVPAAPVRAPLAPASCGESPTSISYWATAAQRDNMDSDGLIGGCDFDASCLPTCWGATSDFTTFGGPIFACPCH